MREYLPFILVGLAIFSGACVLFVAWELTKEAFRDGEPESNEDEVER